MNPQSKAKQFWIEQWNDGNWTTSTVWKRRLIMGNVAQIHVIEFEAYRKAVEALKEISKYTSAYSGASSPEANLAKETLRELGVE